MLSGSRNNGWCCDLKNETLNAERIWSSWRDENTVLKRCPSVLFLSPGGQTYKRRVFWSVVFVISSLLRDMLNVARMLVPDFPFCPHVIDNLAILVLGSQH